MRSRSTSLSIVFVLACAGLGAQERKPPKKPEKPFAVFIFTEGLTNEHVDMPAVTEEVENRTARKKNWLRIVDGREKADIIVEVLTHAVHEQRRTRFNSRVNMTGTGKTMVEETFVAERHHIETRVDFPDGSQVLITGVDNRERGGTMKGAASNFADKLEDHCKEHYWDLIGTR